ncbi:MAG TPA: hypothetical protein VNV85_09870 [Puia sp.]|jgi:predicted transcriptional regulator of viral defense system|nr:hypothetical protein [Puia sp.]
MTIRYSKEKTGLSQQERKLIDSMVMLGKSMIHIADVQTVLNVSKERATLMVSRLSKKGWLQRLKAGVYRIVPLGSETSDPVPEDAMAIAMELFSPGYIGGWTAAEHWDLTEQIFNTTVFYTSKAQRKKDHQIAGLSFKTRLITPEDIFGTAKIWPGNKPILISDMHRTLIDILDDPAMGGGGRMMVDISKAYWNNKEANFEMLWQYASKINHGAVFKRLGLIAEKIFIVSSDQLEKVKDKCKSGIVSLDPNGPPKGAIISKWGIRINIPYEDLQ